MSGFIEGENRYQSTLFPERIDDYVEEESAARVIDVFVDRLDISGLGFKTEAADTGRPGYHPRTMLKIFIYGYMNKVHSSRRLEAEAKRNVELMWLTGRLAPDFKTIADFRKDNGEAIRLVCREFVVLCRRLDLFSKAFVAIDGAKFKAVNTRDKNFTKAKLKRRLQQIDESIERYLGQIATADRREDDVSANKSHRLKDKISALEKEMDRLKKLEVRLLAEPDQQISLTDPDARSMATSGRGTGMVGYNVQVAVDAEHHLIVTHEVTQDGHDRHQLHRMASQAKEALEVDELEVVADRGYFKGEEILACDEDNITTRNQSLQATSRRGCSPSATLSITLRTMNTNVLLGNERSCALAVPSMVSSSTNTGRRTARGARCDHNVPPVSIVESVAGNMNTWLKH